jgi:hypothetical protein
LRIPFAAAVLLSASVPALAVESNLSATSKSSPAEVWAKIGDFCGIGVWHPAVAKCALSGEGKLRRLDLKGGGVINEKQETRDDAAHSYGYTIVDGPLPVADYHSTLSVAAEGAGSKLSWSGKYEAKGASDAEAKKVIDGIYQAGLDALSK